MNIRNTKYIKFSRYEQMSEQNVDNISRTQSISYAPESGMKTWASLHEDTVLPPEKGGKNRVLKVLLILLAALLVGVAGLIVYINVIAGRLHFGLDDDLLSNLDKNKVAAGDPFYMLIIGTDGSQERSESGEYGDVWRADSIILTRIDPKTKQVTLVSIPRDTYVNIDEYGPNKINASLAFGGPALTVQTVSEFAGVPISHYMQVDFDGFKEIVDTLGGVEVNVPIDINDSHTGKLSAGKQVLNGEQALILARSRHAYDDYGDGDIYRAANQRMILGAIAKKMLNSSPATMANTVSSLSNYITTDLTVQDIISLLDGMSGFKTSDILSASCPTGGYYLNDTWYEICFLDDWQEIMGRVDAGLTPYKKESDNKNNGGTVEVEDTITQPDEDTYDINQVYDTADENNYDYGYDYNYSDY